MHYCEVLLRLPWPERSGGEYVSAAAKFRVISKTKHKETQSKGNGRSLLFSFSQPNGLA